MTSDRPPGGTAPTAPPTVLATYFPTVESLDRPPTPEDLARTPQASGIGARVVSGIGFGVVWAVATLGLVWAVATLGVVWAVATLGLVTGALRLIEESGSAVVPLSLGILAPGLSWIGLELVKTRRRTSPSLQPAAPGTLTPVTTLLLASASPARAATLRAAGIEPLIEVAEVDEDAVLRAAAEARSRCVEHLHVTDAVLILARAKAERVACTARARDADVVLGCDSLLDLDGRALGKPGTPERAVRRWRLMRGRSAVLHTGHWVIARNGRTAGAVSSTTVHFAEVSDAEIEAYVATGEPLAVAGAFTIDGLGGAFVTGIEGDHHGVVGLSLPLLRTLLTDVGLAWTDLWASRT